MRFVLFTGVPFLLVTACSGPPEPRGLRSWGGMREVLRDGEAGARIALAGLAGPQTIGVGALADLAGEVTILDGNVFVATASGPQALVRRASRSDSATLLVVEDVARWQPHALGACASYDELEQRIGELLRSQARDVRQPIAVRVRGEVERLRLHVIAGACPIADPTGPSPWRYDGPAGDVELVGFYVEGAAGRFTHHNRHSHLHAMSDRAMGHLDDVVFRGATVFLPAR